MKIRIASFNVENLFSRAKVLNFRDRSVGDGYLSKADELCRLLKKASYTAADKARILELYTSKKELSGYVEVREDRGKLFARSGQKITGVKAGGAQGWDGTIEFKEAKFSEVTRENTARVIKDLRADVACIVEVENRDALRNFDAHLMDSRYKYEMLIDANDPRGIDVGLYSKHPVGRIRTHMFDKDAKGAIFSRDCLEVEVLLPGGRPLHMLCNHFKSRGYDAQGTADQKRKRQATRVAEILGTYDLTTDLVAVAGDLNDNPASAPLQPLLTVPDLYDVLELAFPNNPEKRWTYYYNRFEQIDFLLVSKALKDQFDSAGVERSGIYELEKLTKASNGAVAIEKEYQTVKQWAEGASDHGAVWAQFDI
jgi:endonuclease/exonuclease/phosphatase family metal-dependent hydrolase